MQFRDELEVEEEVIMEGERVGWACGCCWEEGIGRDGLEVGFDIVTRRSRYIDSASPMTSKPGPKAKRE